MTEQVKNDRKSENDRVMKNEISEKQNENNDIGYKNDIVNNERLQLQKN